MSYPENSPYAGRTRTVTFGPQRELPKYADEIQDIVNVNQWNITRRIDQFGKVVLIARKGSLEIKLESDERRALPIKAVKDNRNSWEEPKWIEVPNGENKMSNSLPKDKFVEKHYRDSSILTPTEYLDTLIPEFNEIPRIKELNEIISKVAK
jgi:hypothetical protein